MAFLDYAVPSLGLISGISGLFGASSAQKRAEAQRHELLRKYMLSNSSEEEAMRRNNQRLLAEYAAGLGDALASQGGALGSSLAEAGVYNSSATAGALANQGQANAQALSQFGQSLAAQLAQLRSGNEQNILGQQLGMAQGDIDYARQNYGNSLAGISSFISQLPGFVHPPKSREVNPIQSALGKKTQTTLTGMGVPDTAQTLFSPGFGGTGLLGIKIPQTPLYLPSKKQGTLFAPRMMTLSGGYR